MPNETKGERQDRENTPDGRSEAETAMDVAYRCSDDTGPSLARTLSLYSPCGIEW
jgi:hypothetical protein